MRVAAAALVLLLAGCGVPQDDRPRAIDAAQAPFRTAAPTPAGEPAGPGRVALYFVRDGRVVLASRPVLRSTPVPELLDLLLAGPTADENAAGLSSVIPTTLTVEDVDVQRGIGVVTLGGPPDQAPPTQPLAFAQIVVTLTAPGRLEGVRFRSGDRDLRVPRGDGLLTEQPLDRDDYAELLAPSRPAPTTAVSPS